jgi:hydroxyethylthiazole kinase-like uncharacterized protein yjeF
MHRSRRADAVEALDAALLARWPLPEDEDGDKFVRGTVLVIGGSPVTPGAVILAGMAALRMGAGRLQIATAAPVAPSVAVAVPEALVMPVPVDDAGAFVLPFDDALLERIQQADALLVGPGMRAEASATAVVDTVLRHAADGCILVVDAAALACLPGADVEARERHRGRLVVTPNRQEADRLRDDWPEDRPAGGAGGDAVGDVLAGVACRTGAVVTSFGAVRAPDGRSWDGPRGHPSLGTSGSGDVLAGLVAGAAARARDAAHAACWATYVHATTGERLAAERGALGFLARELIEQAAVQLDAARQEAST